MLEYILYQGIPSCSFILLILLPMYQNQKFQFEIARWLPNRTGTSRDFIYTENFEAIMKECVENALLDLSKEKHPWLHLVWVTSKDLEKWKGKQQIFKNFFFWLILGWISWKLLGRNVDSIFFWCASKERHESHFSWALSHYKISLKIQLHGR